MVKNVRRWRNGQVRWVFGGFGGSSGSVLVIIEWSVDSGCHELSENVWFVWSKTSYSGDKWRCYRCGTDGTELLTFDLFTEAEFCNSFCCILLLHVGTLALHTTCWHTLALITTCSRRGFFAHIHCIMKHQ